MTHRVVVTGLGAITPLGLTAEASWEAAKNGQSGVGPITLFDNPDLRIKLAAEVKGFDPATVIDPREVRRRDRFEWFASAAASEAIDQSGLGITPENAHRIGTAISSSIGGLNSIIEQVTTLNEEGPRRLSPFGIPKIMANGASGMVSIDRGLRGPAFSIVSACASGADGIGMAMHLIRAGVVDAMLAGGSEAPVTPLGIGAFDRVAAASLLSDSTPAPFSNHRDGLVVGEGAGVLVLESLEFALSRGAPILAELIGYGSTSDAFHITAPTEDGAGSAQAISVALADARVDIGDIDYINAHGTGTQLNDISETKAIKLALGERAYEIPTSSTKSMTGHIMGATGAIEAAFCILAIRDNVAPPTINYLEPDPLCDLDYVPNTARDLPIRVAVSNAFGFGGHNAVLVFREFAG
jgi:beta-ketoacyl-acyl-carrier-protein synthase II